MLPISAWAHLASSGNDVLKMQRMLQTQQQQMCEAEQQKCIFKSNERYEEEEEEEEEEEIEVTGKGDDED